MRSGQVSSRALQDHASAVQHSEVDLGPHNRGGEWGSPALCGNAPCMVSMATHRSLHTYMLHLAAAGGGPWVACLLPWRGCMPVALAGLHACCPVLMPCSPVLTCRHPPCPYGKSSMASCSPQMAPLPMSSPRSRHASLPGPLAPLHSCHCLIKGPNPPWCGSISAPVT